MKANMWTKSHADRRSFIGGSDARIILGADETALLRLWQEKRGEVEPEDLSGNLIVQLGVVTEALNRQWYERNSGRAITEVQRHIRHPVNRWMGATLDGMIEDTGAVFEAKFMLPGSFSEEAAAPRIEAVRIVDMSASNSWAELPACSGKRGRPFWTTKNPRASSRH
jgi:predicted phage-related endonuclease